jgi:hypothetical protein
LLADEEKRGIAHVQYAHKLSAVCHEQQLRCLHVNSSCYGQLLNPVIQKVRQEALARSSKLSAIQKQQLRFFHISSCLSKQQLSPEEQKARQEALMRRSLPKRRRLPGVKNIVLVSSGKGEKKRSPSVPIFSDFYYR